MKTAVAVLVLLVASGRDLAATPQQGAPQRNDGERGRKPHRVAWPARPLDRIIATPPFHHRHHREDLTPASVASTFPVLDHLSGRLSGRLFGCCAGLCDERDVVSHGGA
jgi:hypothetical protein